MAWRVAASLQKLLAQLNAKFPNRSKASDGSIGDDAHAARASDHNPVSFPFASVPLVTARDFTHDPVNGINGQWLADTLVRFRDSRIKYVIWNRRIIDSRPGNDPWQWKPYTGTNPHDHHVHVSVMGNPSCEDDRPWNLGEGQDTDHDPTPGDHPIGSRVIYLTDPHMEGDDVRALQTRLNRDYPSYSHLVVDGDFGKATDGVVREFQRRAGLMVDGEAGPTTLRALHLV